MLWLKRKIVLRKLKTPLSLVTNIDLNVNVFQHQGEK